MNTCAVKKKSRPNKEEILNLIWLGLPKQLDSMDPIENDRWLLDVVVVHGLRNIHDWRHRYSCFKIMAIVAVIILHMQQ